MCSTGYWWWQNYWYNSLVCTKSWKRYGCRILYKQEPQNTLWKHITSVHTVLYACYTVECVTGSCLHRTCQPNHCIQKLLCCNIYTMMWHRWPHLVPVIGSVEGETWWLFFFKKGLLDQLHFILVMMTATTATFTHFLGRTLEWLMCLYYFTWVEGRCTVAMNGSTVESESHGCWEAELTAWVGTPVAIVDVSVQVLIISCLWTELLTAVWKRSKCRFKLHSRIHTFVCS